MLDVVSPHLPAYQLSGHRAVRESPPPLPRHPISSPGEGWDDLGEKGQVDLAILLVGEVLEFLPEPVELLDDVLGLGGELEDPAQHVLARLKQPNLK